MKKEWLICILFSGVVFQGTGQTDTLMAAKKDRPFRIETEPTSFVAKGWSFFGSYGIIKSRNLHLGLYSIASTLPSGINDRMFTNVTSADKIRLTFETAASVRYKIPYFLNTESNPYIGLFFGWETFQHTNNSTGLKTKMSNFFLTPQVGYEIYVFRQMLYLNPSVRVVYEFGVESDYVNILDPADEGPRILNWLWLPSVSIGVRL